MQKKNTSKMWQAALTVSAVSALSFPAFVYGQSGNVGASSSESGYSSSQGVMGPVERKSDPESSSTKDTQSSSRTATELSSSDNKNKDKTMGEHAAENDKTQKSGKESTAKGDELSGNRELKTQDQSMKEHDQTAMESEKAKKGNTEAKNTDLSRNSEMKAKDQATKEHDHTTAETENTRKSAQASSSRDMEQTSRSELERDKTKSTLSQGTQTETQHTVVQHVQQTFREDPTLAVVLPRVQIEAPSDDVIVLRGTVQSQEEKQRIITKVRQMRGITRVDDQLQIVSGGTSVHTSGVSSSGPETVVIQHVRETLREDPTLAVVLPRVQIETSSDEVVVLRGTVQNQEEKERIITKVRQVSGVKRVDDQLQIASTSSSVHTRDMDSSRTKEAELTSNSEMKAKDQTTKEHDHMAMESNKDKKSSTEAKEHDRTAMESGKDKKSSTEAKNTDLSHNSEMKAKDQATKEHGRTANDSEKMQTSDKDSSAKSAEHQGNASTASTEKATKTQENRADADQGNKKSDTY